MKGKLRVAIIFDNVGHPSQPFLTEWFGRISKTNELDIVGFTDRFYDKTIAGIKPLKSVSRIEKFIRRVLIRMRSVANRNSDAPLHLWPIVSFDPDIIHILNAQQIDQYKSVLNRKMKLMVSFRGFETSVRPEQDVEWGIRLKRLYNEADRLHMVSDFIRNEAISKGAPPEKCTVLRRSVDTHLFKQIKREENTTLEVLSVGRLTWQKGYNDLLKAFSKVRGNFDCTLTIVGSGEDHNEISDLITELQLNNRVTIVSELNRNDLLKTYQKADIFVLASISDALPNVILEASACSLPVVSTLVGGIPEMVEDGVSGILIQPGDVNALAEAIILLAKDKRLRNQLGLSGRQLMEKEFSSDQEKEKWISVYSSM